jgi:hypothetical protein
MLDTHCQIFSVAVAFQPDIDGVCAPFAVALLTVSAAGIGRITLFSDAGVLERFDAGSAAVIPIG